MSNILVLLFTSNVKRWCDKIIIILLWFNFWWLKIVINYLIRKKNKLLNFQHQTINRNKSNIGKEITTKESRNTLRLLGVYFYLQLLVTPHITTPTTIIEPNPTPPITQSLGVLSSLLNMVIRALRGDDSNGSRSKRIVFFFSTSWTTMPPRQPLSRRSKSKGLLFWEESDQRHIPLWQPLW